MMKEAIIISFDLIRPGELEQSYAMASLMAYVKNEPVCKYDLAVRNISVNAFEAPSTYDPAFFATYLEQINFNKVVL